MAVYKLTTPITEEEIRKLKVNDIVFLNGTIVTARDSAHKRILDQKKMGKKIPVDLKGLGIFHCGPIMKKKNGAWTVIAAGPTTSTRMEMFEEEVIRNFRVRIIIGKGGMGSKTTNAMKRYGAVYGAFTGGTALLAAQAIKKVKSVEWMDLGMPEAMWVFEVEEFGPLIIAIDAKGNNLYKELNKKIQVNKRKIYEKLGL